MPLVVHTTSATVTDYNDEVRSVPVWFCGRAWSCFGWIHQPRLVVTSGLLFAGSLWRLQWIGRRLRWIGRRLRWIGRRLRWIGRRLWGNWRRLWWMERRLWRVEERLRERLVVNTG